MEGQQVDEPPLSAKQSDQQHPDVTELATPSEPRTEGSRSRRDTPSIARASESSPGRPATGKRKRQASRETSEGATESSNTEQRTSRPRQPRGRKRARAHVDSSVEEPLDRRAARSSPEAVGTRPSRPDQQREPSEAKMPSSDSSKSKDHTSGKGKDSGKGKGKGREYSDTGKSREGTADTESSANQDGSKRGRSRTGYN